MAPMRYLAALACLAACGCAPDLRDDFPFDGALPDGTYVAFEDEGAGSTRLTVDATNKTSFVYLDLDAMAELHGAEAIDSGAWDLGFQRYKIIANGGGGGPGPVEIAVITGATEGSYEALTQAPATGYQQDGAEPVFNAAEGGWYYYDLGVHRLLTRAELLYVVHSSAGAYFKVQMLSYYDENGTSGRLKLRAGTLAPP